MKNIRKEKFTEIFKTNFWNSKETVSGGGSELKNTQNVIKKLPLLLKKYNIKTMLDCACGDLNWMIKVNLCIDNYIGIDIVEDIIKKNKELYESDTVKFYVMDFVIDELPKADLILCKDVFIHLPNKDIIEAIQNFKKSGAKYLLVTNSFVINKNEDGVLGGCRGMNFQLKPFCLGEVIDNIEIGTHNSNLTLFKL